MTVKIYRGDIHLIDLKTRLPFKYGIATMTSAPHAFVRVHVDVDGQSAFGIAADHLPPKWFTKVPDQDLDSEIDEMLRVIEHAVDVSAGLNGDCAFDVWRQFFQEQAEWGKQENLPPLLSNFGATLVERALIEAVCKIDGQSFSEAVRSSILGVRLEEFDDRLSGQQPSDLLPMKPPNRVIARHTIGMADPLTDDDITDDERLNDGLPQSLVACIQRYGLRHFKVKVRGDLEADTERLNRIAQVIQTHAMHDYAFTLDGNEQFRSLEQFQEYWSSISHTESLQTFFEHLLFVEQPFHRDVALDPTVLGEMARWSERPRLIIDESDAEMDSLPRALQLGYHGTSHKNCKGVFKGIANACLLEKLRRDSDDPYFIMSGEDLANIGPVALLQDLAVVGTLGVQSVERNGHHYFAGLSAFPKSVQEQMLASHGDLYHRTEAGWPSLSIQDGELAVTSLNAAPLGVGFEIDVDQMASNHEWRQQPRQ